MNLNSANGSLSVTPQQGDQYWEARVHNFTLPVSGTQFLVYFQTFEITVDSLGNLYLNDSVDTLSGGNGYVITQIPAGSTDFMIRAQRCTVAAHCTWAGGNGNLELEAWDISGTGYSSAIAQIARVGTVTSSLVLVGNIGTTADLAYIRWYSGLVPMSTNVDAVTPPYPNGNLATGLGSCFSSGGNIVGVIGDWEFESSNGNDCSGNGNTLGISGASYPSTPTPAPGCVLPPTSFSTTFPVQLSSATCGSTQDSSALTYTWSYAGIGADGVTQTPTFSSTSAANPTVTGLVRGSFNVTLQACDAVPQCTTTTVHDGVVVSDGSHNVQSTGFDSGAPGGSRIDKYYMPMVQWGYNPQPYFDDRMPYIGNFFGGLQSTLFAPTWNTALSGGVWGANGSNTLTLTGGANAQADFCNGTSTGNLAYIIVWNTITEVSGPWVQYRSQYLVTACPTTSTVTISPNYRDASISSGSPAKLFDDVQQ